MRIAYLSDLHLEFEAECGAVRAAAPFDMERALANADNPDLIVLAGDIDIGERGIERANAIARFSGVPAVYVAGNHEAYGFDLTTLEPRLRAAAWRTDGRVVFLNCNVVRFWFDGEPLVVLGCTLWTDHKLKAGSNGETKDSDTRMNDEDHILWDSGSFRPANAQALHREHRNWLDSQLKKLANETPTPRIIVVTHHAPIPQALGERSATLAHSYASDLRSEIAAWPQLVWIHGHTHHRHETRLGKSAVVSAPRGYPQPDGIIEDFACGILDI